MPILMQSRIARCQTRIRTFLSHHTLPASAIMSSTSTVSLSNDHTKVLQVDPSSISFPHIIPSNLNTLEAAPLFSHSATESVLRTASCALKMNKVVAIPTETVYGLAGNALSSEAVESIFRAKQRPSDNPLIVHVASLDMLRSILPNASIPPSHMALIHKFWPGPLTLLFPVAPNALPSSVTAGLPTVAVRFPSNPVARALIQLTGVPLAMPSANSSGKPSPTLASHVFSDLCGRVPYVVDGGQCDHGLESTVLTLSPTPTILRPGSVTVEQLRAIPGLENIHAHAGYTDDGCAPISPGMKYRHYCPRAPVYLLMNPSPHAAFALYTQLSMSAPQSRVGWFLASPHSLDSALNLPPNKLFVTFDGREAPSRELFKGLRWFDDNNVCAIIVDAVPEEGIGLAFMNRIRKAATHVVN